jgi:hypothetical protein
LIPFEGEADGSERFRDGVDRSPLLAQHQASGGC